MTRNDTDALLSWLTARTSAPIAQSKALEASKKGETDAFNYTRCGATPYDLR